MSDVVLWFRQKRCCGPKNPSNNIPELYLTAWYLQPNVSVLGRSLVLRLQNFWCDREGAWGNCILYFRIYAWSGKATLGLPYARRCQSLLSTHVWLHSFIHYACMHPSEAASWSPSKYMISVKCCLHTTNPSHFACMSIKSSINRLIKQLVSRRCLHEPVSGLSLEFISPINELILAIDACDLFIITCVLIFQHMFYL